MAITQIINNTDQYGSRTIQVAFGVGYVPKAGDVVYMDCSSDVISAITTPAGWANPLGGNTLVASDSHSQAALYHIVTTAEEVAVTTTYVLTNVWNATATGTILGVILRGVDPSNPVDSAASTFNSSNTVTPHVFAALTGANLSSRSMVIAAVTADGLATYTTPANWSQVTFHTNTQGHYMGSRDALTVAGTNVAATNITPSVGDEYCSITTAFKEWRPNPALRPVSVSGKRAGFY